MHILENHSLKPYNTFGVSANARYFVAIQQEQELLELFANPRWKQVNLLVLGSGSNILFTQDFDGLVIQMCIKGITHTIKHHEVIVTAGAGELWQDLVNYCLARGFAGIENLSYIPGSVGAAPVQNIGAYGSELKDVFYTCRVFDSTVNTFKLCTKDDCRFAYRDSIFKQMVPGTYIICSLQLLLSLTPTPPIHRYYKSIDHELSRLGIQHPSIQDIAQVITEIRRSKLPNPSAIGNAGSFFKNPIVTAEKFQEIHRSVPNIAYFPINAHQIKIAAGWMIEQCGWKGKIVGRTGTWKNQALVLVNYGHATGAEIYNLSSQIMDSVYKKFAIQLEREVSVV